MDDFHTQMVALLPKLRVWARTLARDRAMSEDLVQDTVVCALRGRDGFTPGTNLRAWLYCILRNQHISALRRQRETHGLDELSEERFAMAPQHENRLMLQELRQAFWRLQPDNREALMLVIQGMSYEEIAAAPGCSCGFGCWAGMTGRRSRLRRAEGVPCPIGPVARGRATLVRRCGHDGGRQQQANTAKGLAHRTQWGPLCREGPVPVGRAGAGGGWARALPSAAAPAGFREIPVCRDRLGDGGGSAGGHYSGRAHDRPVDGKR